MATIPTLVFVGGYLGAGKTTLLVQAARLLRDSGVRVALITNDQGGSLVDTLLAETSGTQTEEVTGGCFCCRFTDLIEATKRLREFDPEVILAEPVGSCIDVSATVLQPIKRFHGERFRLAPYTVLVDPRRAEEMLAKDADPYLSYLFWNQIAEADLVCFNKADITDRYPELPTGSATRMSARTGAGVAGWLNEVLAGKMCGTRGIDVDYEFYAAAEATLGWLNWQADLELTEPLSPSVVAGPFLDALEEQLSEAGIAIAHLKVLDRAESGFIKASLCRNDEEPTIDGDLAASPGASHQILLNLRAAGAPEDLRRIVSRVAELLPGTVSVTHFETFRPAPPKPEHRIREIV